MWQLIRQIGQVVERRISLDSLFLKEGEERKYRSLVAVDFCPEEEKIRLSPLYHEKKHLPREVLAEYVYVGVEGGTRPQFVLTVTADRGWQIFQQILANLYQGLLELESLRETALRRDIESLLETFFEKESRFGTWLPRSGLIPAREIDLSQVKGKEGLRKLCKEVYQEAFEKMWEETPSLSGLTVKKSLLTVFWKGSALVKYPEYTSFLLAKKLGVDLSKQPKGVCNFCGRQGHLQTKPTKSKFKVYITQKITFAPYFDEKLWGDAMGLCGDCYRQLLIGEQWVEKHLKSRLGGFEVYILPEIPPSKEERTFERLQRTVRKFDSARKGEELSSPEEEAKKVQTLEMSADRVAPQMPWHLFFGKKAQSAYKVYLWLPEVPPHWIRTLWKTLRQINRLLEDSFPQLTLTLDKIFYLIPLRKKSGEIVERSKILAIYRALFSQQPLDKKALLAHYASLAHLHYFGNYANYQIASQPEEFREWALAKDTVLWAYFLLFLKKLSLLEKGDAPMAQQGFEVFPEDFQKYVETFELGPIPTALALLGYCVGMVAYAQALEKLTKKPILAKLDYQGMSREKVLRLFNTIFEKIYQYQKSIGYAEPWLATANALYASTEDSLTSHERLFYILLGYSLQRLYLHGGRDTVETEAQQDLF